MEGITFNPKFTLCFLSIFLVFTVLNSAVECRATEKPVDTISEDWKRLPTHMEFRDWLLNQFKEQGILPENPNPDKPPKYHIIIIQDFGDSSDYSEYSDSYSDESYSGDSYSQSDESSGDSPIENNPNIASDGTTEPRDYIPHGKGNSHDKNLGSDDDEDFEGETESSTVEPTKQDTMNMVIPPNMVY